MNGLIDIAFGRSRTVLLALAFILVAGAGAYQSIPKEAEPEITVPFIYVSMTHEGISPDDAERLLIRPMENEHQSIEGVKEMTSTARQGHASVQLEFSAGFDSKRTLTDVRERMDIATELPETTDEPSVHEVNVALFPILTIALSGLVPERGLVRIARDLKDQIDALRVPTATGMVPIANFVQVTPAPKTGTLHRLDARRVVTIRADVGEGMLADDQLKRLRAAIGQAELD
ncbi:MAG: efflux RND transporter permease subunit, partial [Thiohalocapsa sp.]